MKTCILCTSKIKRFIFTKKRDKSVDLLTVCNKCKKNDPKTSNLFSSHNEEQIIDLLQNVDISKVFKCLTRLKSEKYKNLAQYKLILQSILKIDFTQTLCTNIHDIPLVSTILSYPTKIQWRKMCNDRENTTEASNYTVLEYTLLNVTDPKVLELLRKKILYVNNIHTFLNTKIYNTNKNSDLYILPTKPPPYNSLNFEEYNSTQPVASAPIEISSSWDWHAPKTTNSTMEFPQPYGFSGKWLLLYNNN